MCVSCTSNATDVAINGLYSSLQTSLLPCRFPSDQVLAPRRTRTHEPVLALASCPQSEESLDSAANQEQAPLVTPRRFSAAHVALGIVGALFVAAMAALVFAPTTRDDVPSYQPEVNPVAAGAELVGPVVYTIDGRAPDAWRFFRFGAGSVVTAPDPMGWDLAVRRNRLIVNGGTGFAGTGGIAVLGPVAFDSVAEAPQEGYLTTRAGGDSTVASFKWYSYGFSSHVLTPRGDVYAIRTADGRYAKMEILSYYCTGAEAGCMTIRYTYQGDGSRSLAPPFPP